ncbi:GNAT family N-acetyltransferase [Streptomyces griseus]
MLKDTAPPGDVIRPAIAADLPEIARLCAAHVAFERAEPTPVDLATRLKPVLFSARPRAWCLVVDHGGELIGYATCSLEFSTWQATDYVHLDCLFVTEPYRGEDWGHALLNAAKNAATPRGAAHMQWQTPTGTLRVFSVGVSSCRGLRLMPVANHGPAPW